MFLPENEIHELGLMYLNYELSLRGKKTIYLGQSIPLDNLNSLLTMFSKINFISSFTVSPEDSIIIDYLEEISTKLKDTNHEFLAFGYRTQNLNSDVYDSRFSFYPSLIDLLKEL